MKPQKGTGHLVRQIKLAPIAQIPFSHGLARVLRLVPDAPRRRDAQQFVLVPRAGPLVYLRLGCREVPFVHVPLRDAAA
jgi:hypothetical protein